MSASIDCITHHHDHNPSTAHSPAAVISAPEQRLQSLDVDVQRLLGVLRLSGVSVDNIVSIDISKEPNLPVHFTSICYFVSLQFRNKPSPLELFVKRLKANAEIKENDDFSLFEKEAAFYTQVVPSINSFCVQRSESHEVLEMLPKVYFANEGEIIMENLMSKSYSVLDRKNRHNFQQASLVMKALGNYHGASYAFIQELGGREMFEKRFPETQEKMMKRWGVGYSINEMMIDSTLVKLASLLKESTLPGSEFAYKGLSLYMNCGFSTMCDVVEGRHLFHVLNHGDCWGNNILFGQRSSENNSLIKFVDFQMTRVGSPNLDISYYLYNSVVPELRRTDVVKLLETYFDEFKNRVVNLGGSLDFDLKDFIEDYGRISKLGFLYGVYIAAASPLMGKVDLDNSANWIEDFVAAIAENMEKCPSERDTVLVEVIGMVHDFAQLGRL